jgi:hypothetical protein
MRKRTKVALFLVVGAAVLAGTAYFLLRTGSPINPWAYQRIKAGMTREEVEAVFGLPVGDYRSPERRAAAQTHRRILDSWGDAGVHAYPDSPMPQPGEAEDIGEWLGNEFVVQVGFGADGGVTGCLLSTSRESSSAWSALYWLKAKAGR